MAAHPGSRRVWRARSSGCGPSRLLCSKRRPRFRGRLWVLLTALERANTFVLTPRHQDWARRTVCSEYFVSITRFTAKALYGPSTPAMRRVCTSGWRTNRAGLWQSECRSRGRGLANHYRTGEFDRIKAAGFFDLADERAAETRGILRETEKHYRERCDCCGRNRNSLERNGKN